MSLTRTPERPYGSLTKEQKVLARGVPGLAERIAYDHIRRFGRGGLEPADLLQNAHLGIYRAAQLYEAKKRVPFEKWAYFKGACTVLDAVRKNQRLAKPLEGYRTKAGQEYLASKLELPENEVQGWVTEEGLLDQLVEIAEDHVGAELTGAACGISALNEEERIGARLDWGQAYGWLEHVLGEIEPAYRRALVRVHAEDTTLQEALAAEGINYWAAMRELPKLFKRSRARLEGLGLRQLPEGHGEWGAGVLKRAVAAWSEAR